MKLNSVLKLNFVQRLFPFGCHFAKKQYDEFQRGNKGD